MKKEKSKFRFKKEFGQNFIFDTKFLNEMVSDLMLEKSSNILEIGAGMGSLTKILAERFKKVVSFEIDKTLTEKLKKIETQNSNLKIVLSDVLKMNTSEIDEMFLGESFNIVANIPYNITSQIVFKFFFESNKLDKMFVMVQKEVGERFIASPSTSEYGIPSVLLSTFGECKMVKQVNRNMFFPVPKVDSCVIMIKRIDQKFGSFDKEKFENFLSCCFSMKRKTLVNNLLKMNTDKEKIESILIDLNLDKNVRPENLSAEDYVKLFRKFF
ncbi:MAG: ribosomal RNA small subunit methyltransferase A [Clostridia bacterium]|nr:ribosomal RNA small subunit methyltransferase A [Clostridia bacterium]